MSANLMGRLTDALIGCMDAAEIAGVYFGYDIKASTVFLGHKDAKARVSHRCGSMSDAVWMLEALAPRLKETLETAAPPMWRASLRP